MRCGRPCSSKRQYAALARHPTLLADFSAFTGPGAGTRLKRLDNTEGMSWGPVLPNGRRSLMFISDDNFSARQTSQWLAFEFLD